jgi:UDP-N-acetyl-D-mannosaminuronate dehydrogenase/intein/homing endonuclease
MLRFREMPDSATDLAGRLASAIDARTAKVGVIGLGYVGLPLVLEFHRAGFPVMGFDIDQAKVDALHAGKSYIAHIDGARIGAAVKGGRFDATSDFRRLAEADAILICVPTPLTRQREPDLSYIEKTADAIAAVLRPGQLVVLESTTYPGTTEEVVQPRLEAGGQRVEQDYFLAFSPEREDPGNPDFSTRTIPKVVGGVGPQSARLAAALYKGALDRVVQVSSARVAEAVKILENTYRAVNIALVNELKVTFDAMDIDVWEVIEAARTKPFGYAAFYPGPGLGGHCLSGRETVCIRDGPAVRVLPLDELFDRAPTRRQFRVREVDVTVPDGLEVLSVDPADGQTRFSPVSHLFRRTSSTPLLRLRLKDNRHLSVTDGHPMLCSGDRGIDVRLARDLRAGDRIVIAGSWPADAVWTPCLDLLDASRVSGVAVRVMPRAGRWKDHETKIAPAAARYGVSPKDVWKHNTLPLPAFLELEARGETPFRRQDVLLSTGKGSSWNQIPAHIRIDEDFARLVGYYLSEGCLTEDESLRIRFCFGAHEQDLIADARSILSRLGVRSSVHKLKRWQTVHVKVSSRLFGLLFREVLKCGRNSYEMQVPAQLMAAPSPIRRALLAGLLRGDGDVHLSRSPRGYRKNGRGYRHSFNAATVGYFTASPLLFQQVTLLLQGMGLFPTFRKARPHLRMSGSQVHVLTSLLAGAKKVKLETYQARRLKPMAPRAAKRHGPYASVELASVEPAPSEPVYSMEVEGTGTFITSYGIAVHNCIPIDPFYLTWKAREYGLSTRFIELAGEVNTGMPGYVVRRLAAALNEAGKPLRGTRVLVLGAAYKKNIADVRESPALEIIEMLQEAGARVDYHDPHIPFLPRMRRHQLELSSVPLDGLAQYDAAVVVTDHAAVDYAKVAATIPLIVDTRNVYKSDTPARARIVKA